MLEMQPVLVSLRGFGLLTLQRTTGLTLCPTVNLYSHASFFIFRARSAPCLGVFLGDLIANITTQPTICSSSVV